MNLLNLGSGNIDVNEFDGYDKVVHLDRKFKKVFPEQTVEYVSRNWSVTNKSFYCGDDIFEFLISFPYKFDHIRAYRIFEHMEYASGQIGELLELLNCCTHDIATLDIVVPNMLLIADMLKRYEENSNMILQTEALATKLIINTEMTNMKYDPHASVWTPVLAKEYIESEKTWEITEIDTPYSLTNRHIYMRILCQKPTKK